MGKRTPLACTESNCGGNFSRCGKRATYVNHRCRCDACSSAMSDYNRRYRKDNLQQIKETNREWYLSNRNEVLDRQKKYYQNNRPEILEAKLRYKEERRAELAAKSRDYYAENQEKVRETARRRYLVKIEERRAASRSWAQQNPEAVRRAGAARRARKRAAPTIAFTTEQLAQRLDYYGNRCYLRLDGCTYGSDHIDHVKPLNRGGSHMLCNLRPACESCNRRKSDKWPFNFQLRGEVGDPIPGGREP
jgi:5-methylcytosine-specific restriction endonuclease McrA